VALGASCGGRSAASTNAGSGDSTNVPVLVYHSVARHHAGQTGEQRELDVDTSSFRQQMDYLEEHQHPVVPFDQLIDQLQGKIALPAGAVVITFDDGWLDQYEFAFPILQQHHFTATFFIYTNAIGNGQAFMTWDELRQLQQAGMTIGAHSRTHPKLTAPNVSLNDEIAGSRADIQRNLGVSPDLFAYPYGLWDRRVVAAVQAAGFRAARGLGDGPMNTPSTIFTIRSIAATDDMPSFERAIASRSASTP
jgi:peptidoglycan/xylan/chitin deacetylase (PgdA/CDA1 family)